MKKLKQLDDAQAEKCLEEFSGVIYQVMTQLRLSFYTADADEFIQQGSIALLHALIAFGENPYIGESRYKFVAFAKTRIRWKFLDILRQENKKKMRESHLDSSYENVADTQTTGYEYIAAERVLALRHHLTNEEWRYIHAVVFEGISSSAFAKREGIHRSTVYKRRAKLAEKLKPLIAKWD